MICIPLAADTNERMFELISRAERQSADCYEYRFDRMEERPEVERLIQAASRPVMATCRSVDEGGSFRGGFADRRAILRRAGRAGAAYIDSEAGDLDSLADCGGAIRIVSMHDFRETPADLAHRVSALCATSADWIKFAVTARSHGDNLKLFAALARSGKPAIAIAMGEMGTLSRIVGRRYGSRITFGSLDTGLESAPGQITAGELADLYRVRGLGGATRLHGCLGHPDRPTKAHVAYNRAFANAGMDAVCIPFHVRDAGEFLNAIPDGIGLRQLVVDELHGREAFRWAGHATRRAERAGRANLLYNMDGHWLADYSESPSASESAIIRNAAR